MTCFLKALAGVAFLAALAWIILRPKPPKDNYFVGI